VQHNKERDELQRLKHRVGDEDDESDSDASSEDEDGVHLAVRDPTSHLSSLVSAPLPPACVFQRSANTQTRLLLGQRCMTSFRAVLCVCVYDTPRCTVREQGVWWRCTHQCADPPALPQMDSRASPHRTMALREQHARPHTRELLRFTH
jgi:hypothetical protein